MKCAFCCRALTAAVSPAVLLLPVLLTVVLLLLLRGVSTYVAQGGVTDTGLGVVGAEAVADMARAARGGLGARWRCSGAIQRALVAPRFQNSL